jgi:hypothetical protein
VSDNLVNQKYIPASDDNELVLRWLLRARESQFAHYEMGVIFDRWNKWFGVPVIAITTIVSGSIFSVIQKDATGEMKYWTMGLSLLAVVLTSLQTFLKFSERAEKHRAAAAEYGVVRRRLEVLHISSQKSLDSLNKLGEEISALGSRVPAISNATFNRIKKKIAA